MNEVIIYRSEDNQIEVNVRADQETVWLSQQQMVDLFDRTKQNISLHINNCFKEGELDKKATVKESLIVQKEGQRSVKRKVEYYNLDVIISVGYRVKSKRGTQLRIWANRILKDYLVQGFAINKKLLQEKTDQLQSLKRVISLQERVLTEYQLNTNETEGLLYVITNYSKALSLLDDYDHQRLVLPTEGHKAVCRISYAEARKAVDALGKQTHFEGLFGKEKDNSFESSLSTIYQTHAGNDLYPSTEEKAANLLYFIVKNHSFVDGNKRIAAFLFVWFLERNKILYKTDGSKLIDDNSLVALTLLIAESPPNDKDMIIKVIVNLMSLK